MKMEWSVNLADVGVDPEVLRLFYADAPERQERALLIRYDQPASLRTGRRGSRSGAEHARVLKLARLKRRVARRENRPACVVHCTTYLPRVLVEVDPTSREAPGAQRPTMIMWASPA